jgi:hypothetical protein
MLPGRRQERRFRQGARVPAPLNVLVCAVVALVFWTIVGLPLAQRLMPGRGLMLAAAPALGWAAISPMAFLVLLASGFTRVHVALLVGVVVVAGLAALALSRRPASADHPTVPWWGFVLALSLAAVPALAVLPKIAGGGVLLAPIAFDHTKVAIIDEMVRQGLPPGNAFFGAAGAPAPFAYYYLWHFGAAVFALLLGVSGWEADAACSGATAAASLLLVIGLAVELSGRRGAALWVAIIALTASARPLVALLLGRHALDGLLAPDAQLQTWIVQASWAPQHLAAATSLVIAVLLLVRLAQPRGWPAAAALALVVAASFEASVWIGGITFAAAAGPVALLLLVTAEPRQRWPFIARAVAAAIGTIVLAVPFLHDEAAVTAARAAGSPIAFAPYAVLGTAVPAAWRRLLDLPAYWLVLPVLEFPAFYLAGLAALRSGDDGRGKGIAPSLGLLALCGLVVGWLLESTIANNDLGWRASLPSVLVLTVFAAIGLARWRGLARSAAIILVLAGLPGGILFMRENLQGRPSRSAALFAETPEMWAAVRRHVAPGQRVGNNPLAFWDATSWPINASWALLADRPSCYAGWVFGHAFVALPPVEIDGIDARFTRVFAGDGTADDVHLLATRYQCHVVVVTVEDGAWQRDPFVASPDYRLVETKDDRWRIYEATGG